MKILKTNQNEVAFILTKEEMEQFIFLMGAPIKEAVDPLKSLHSRTRLFINDVIDIFGKNNIIYKKDPRLKALIEKHFIRDLLSSLRVLEAKKLCVIVTNEVGNLHSFLLQF
jgi:hypothetical protein